MIKMDIDNRIDIDNFLAQLNYVKISDGTDLYFDVEKVEELYIPLDKLKSLDSVLRHLDNLEFEMQDNAIVD